MGKLRPRILYKVTVCGKTERSWILLYQGNTPGTQHLHPSPSLPLYPCPSCLLIIFTAPTTLAGMSISPPATEWDCLNYVPHGGDVGSPSPPVQGQGILGLSRLSQASKAGSRLGKRGQLWGTGPSTAGTAAITSGLERAAGRGAGPN